LKKPNHLFFHKHNIKILWSIPFLVSVVDWKLALTAFWLVTFIGTSQDNLVNVYGHIKGWVGYRNFNTKDNSQNNFFLGYFAWGQGWHNNHHHAPASYDFGSGVSGKWWEFDPCRIFLPFLGKSQN
jgi:stearoyl-CoA desaturase (delta-9 desaturase)